MKTIFENVIARGNYDLTGLLKKIDSYHIDGTLTDEERNDLYAQARHEAKAQYDVDAEIEKLWAAIRALQNGQGSGGNAGSADEWPEYVQPTGAHDAYQNGDKVTYNGTRYICAMNACVWSPDVLPSAWVEYVETEETEETI